MKKLSLALALLGLSSTATYAGGIDYQEPEDAGMFSVGVEALYVQPNGSDFLYGQKTVSSSATSTVNRSLGVDGDYQWGYHVDVQYVLPGDGPDITLGYTHLDSDDSESKSGLSSTAFSGITIPAAASAVVANAKSDYDYIDVDLLLGKEFVLQNRYHFHPFAGVRYASIDTKDRASYNVTAAAATTTSTGEVRNDFDGVGPRVGLDAGIEVANGFSLVARAAGSMIIGNYDWKSTTTTSTTSNTVRNSEENILVPEADYRLGVNYTHHFSPETSVGVELGWTTVHYFDALDKTDTAGSLSDWGFQGPYLRVQANIA
jgi:hypothetical protein